MRCSAQVMPVQGWVGDSNRGIEGRRDNLEGLRYGVN
jgi:hypothetical protein